MAFTDYLKSGSALAKGLGYNKISGALDTASKVATAFGNVKSAAKDPKIQSFAKQTIASSPLAIASPTLFAAKTAVNAANTFLPESKPVNQSIPTKPVNQSTPLKVQQPTPTYTQKVTTPSVAAPLPQAPAPQMQQQFSAPTTTGGVELEFDANTGTYRAKKTAPTISAASTETSPQISDFLKQRTALLERLSSSQQPTEEELALTQRLSDIAAQQEKIGVSEELGLNKLQDQPIEIGLITGQQAALQRQAAVQQRAKQAEALPLQQRLALIQAERARNADIIKNQIEQSAPLEIGGNLINPVTGEIMFSQGAGEGFTLGEGQARYDAAGNLLAAAPKAEPALTPYQAAQLEIEQQKLAQGKQLTPDQINRISEGNQMPAVLQGLNDIIDKNSMIFGPVFGRITAANPYASQAQAIQAQLKRAMQSIGKYLEGGVLRAEDEKKYEKMLPQLTDTPEVAKAKLTGIQDLLNSKQQQYLMDIQTGGYNASNFSNDTTDFSW